MNGLNGAGEIERVDWGRYRIALHDSDAVELR